MQKRKKSLESIKKMVETRRKNGSYVSKHKGEKRPPRSLEWCKNISLGKIGKKPWNYGLKTGPHTKEHNEKISCANKGKTKPPFSVEHIENIRRVMLGPANARRGIKALPETIEKIKLARSKQKIPMRDSIPEKLVQLALSIYKINFEKHKMIKNGKGFYHAVDIFIEPNLCIEIDGDYWHSLPKTILRDMEVNHQLNLLGYFVIRLKESDIRNNLHGCSQNIIKHLQSKSEVVYRMWYG